MKKYCDETAFIHYVLKYYTHGLISEEESEILTYIKVYFSLPLSITDEKVEAVIERLTIIPPDRQKKYAIYRDRELADEYEYRIARRIAEELGDNLNVNRCVKCQSILRTNKAHWCEWCGHYRKSVLRRFLDLFSK